MQPYFAVPIEDIVDESFKYFRDAAMKTNGSVTLDVSLITFFEDWWDLEKNRSATIQLLIFPDSIYGKYDDESVDKLTFLYMDIAKFFDKVSHYILMKKPKKFEVGGKCWHFCIHTLKTCNST